MKVHLATDHAGFELKEQVKSYLVQQGFNVEDSGAHEYKEDDDYPDLIKVAAGKVAADPQSKGIVFGKSGAGEVIVANKIKGIRAALGVNEENVRLAREHNDANVLSFGADFISDDLAKKLSKLFLNTQFLGDERHKRRIDKIREIENNA